MSGPEDIGPQSPKPPTLEDLAERVNRMQRELLRGRPLNEGKSDDCAPQEIDEDQAEPETPQSFTGATPYSSTPLPLPGNEVERIVSKSPEESDESTPEAGVKPHPRMTILKLTATYEGNSEAEPKQVTPDLPDTEEYTNEEPKAVSRESAESSPGNGWSYAANPHAFNDDRAVQESVPAKVEPESPPVRFVGDEYSTNEYIIRPPMATPAREIVAPQGKGRDLRKFAGACMAITLLAGGAGAAYFVSERPIDTGARAENPEPEQSAKSPAQTVIIEKIITQPQQQSSSETIPTAPEETEDKDNSEEREDKKAASSKKDSGDKDSNEETEASEPQSTAVPQNQQNNGSRSQQQAPRTVPKSSSDKVTQGKAQRQRASSPAKTSTKRTSRSSKRSSTSKANLTSRKTGAAKYGDKKLRPPKKTFPRGTGGATPHHPTKD